MNSLTHDSKEGNFVNEVGCEVRMQKGREFKRERKSEGNRGNVHARGDKQVKPSLFYRTSNRKDGSHWGLRRAGAQTDPTP